MRNPGSISTFTGRLFLAGAAGLSFYLACGALGRVSLTGCETGSSCAAALRSPPGFVFGLPVSFPGFLLYSLCWMLSGAFVRRDRGSSGVQAAAALSAAMAGAAWFGGLQIKDPRSFCLWCSLVHGCVVLGVLFLSFARAKHPAGTAEPRHRSHVRHGRIAAAGAALLCMGVLAGGASFPTFKGLAAGTANKGEKPSATPAPAPAGIPLFGGKFHVNPADFPVLGRESPEPVTVVLLSDYTSSLCRQYHSAVETTIPSAARPVRVLLLPAALTPEATKIQRTLLAVYHTDRKAWRSLSALLTSGQIPAEPEAVERTARKLAGADRLTDTLESSGEQIDRDLELAASLLEESRAASKSASVPVLIEGDRTLFPSTPDMDELLSFVSGGAASTASVPPASSGESVPKGAPILSLPEKEVALEFLEPGKARDIQIEVRNSGTASLTLSWLSLDAGCELTRLPKTVPPGRGAHIGLRVTPVAEETPFSRSIQIHSDAGDGVETVTLHGTTGDQVVSSSRPLEPES